MFNIRLKSRFYRVICVPILCSFSALSVASACDRSHKDGAFIVGEVTDKKNGDVLYCEFHINLKTDEAMEKYDVSFAKPLIEANPINKAKAATLVKYANAKGELIAKKLLVYGDNPVQPNAMQVDSRYDEKRIAFKKGSDWQVGFKAHDASKVDYKALSANTFINDAGFNDLVKKEWDTLTGGDGVSFPFLLIKQFKTVDLRAKKSRCKWDAPDSSVCFSIKIDNTVLSWFVGGLSLEYDKKTRQLLTFEGVVNILDENKKTPKARIEYRYL